MSIEDIEKTIISKRNIRLKSLYKLLREVNDAVFKHQRTCNPGKVDLINHSVFCKGCGELLLNFCPFCGSTRIESRDSFKICHNCGKVNENYY